MRGNEKRNIQQRECLSNQVKEGKERRGRLFWEPEGP